MNPYKSIFIYNNINKNLNNNNKIKNPYKSMNTL